MTTLPWADDAACKDQSPSAWYSTINEVEAFAKSICFDCPVREQCLDHALAVKEPAGVWGGMNAKERHNYLQRQARERRKKAS